MNGQLKDLRMKAVWIIRLHSKSGEICFMGDTEKRRVTLKMPQESEKPPIVPKSRDKQNFFQSLSVEEH